MPTDKVSCKQCGDAILPTTAAKTEGFCMPCKNGARTVLEDFDVVRQKWRRCIVSVTDSASNFTERYLAGDMEAVWSEMHRLDLREPTAEETLNDVTECVRLAMRRIRSNIECLIRALDELGYKFWFPNRVHVPPSSTDLESLRQLEETCGPLPLTLRIFYEEVGSVDLRQSQEQLIKWQDPNRERASMLELLGEEDPLVVFPVSELADEVRNELPRLSRNFFDPPGSSRLYCCLAPDEFHKANYSGGENYNVYLPEPSVDFLLVGAWLDSPEESASNESQYPVSRDYGPSEFFMSHLRKCLQGAGFRGRADVDNFSEREPPKWEPLAEIARDLLPV